MSTRRSHNLSLCAGRTPGYMCSSARMVGFKMCPVGHSLVPVKPPVAYDHPKPSDAGASGSQAA
ncbi:UNVERIFIED_ORG: hypothetical protein M2328_006378 [Rhodococcus erythropolis]